MSSTSELFWVSAFFTLKDTSSGSTMTVRLSSSPVEENDDYLPLLLGVDGLGSTVGETLPIPASGSIRVQNQPGSLGWERRFSDYFDRYTLIDQSVVVYSNYTLDDGSTTSNQDFKGRVASYSIDPEGEVVTFEVTGRALPKRYVTRQIDIATYPSAPSGSIGQAVPVVFGTDQTVKPIRLDADGDTSPSYAYATTWANTFTPSGVSHYYAKDDEGKYGEVVSASNVSTAVISMEAGTEDTNGFLSLFQEFGWHLTGTANYVVTAIRLKFAPENDGGWAAGDNSLFVFKIWRNNALTGVPEKTIAVAKRLKSVYESDIQGSSNFFVEAAFDKPAVLSSSDGYSLTVSQTVDTGAGTGTGDYVNIILDTASTATPIVIRTFPDPDNGIVDQWYLSDATGAYREGEWDLYGCKFTDTPTPGSWNEEGQGISIFETTQHTGIGSDYGTPDLTKLDLIVSVNGLRDDSGGTLSGSAFASLNCPLLQIKLLERTWNGSAWGADSFASSKFTSTQGSINGVTTHRYYRLTGGFTQGRTTLEQLVSEILEDSGCKLALVNATNTNEFLGLYAWGTTLTTSAVITDEESRVEDIEIRGTESIVNAIKAPYRRSLLNFDTALIASQGANTNYLSSLEWYNGSSGIATSYTSVSETVYGRRYLNDPVLNWIADSTSADHWAEYVLSTFSKPAVYVTLRVPLRRYRTLEVLDVVEIKHPDLPNYFGTSSDAKTAHWQGAVADVTQGFPLKRANRYRGQLESKRLNYNFGGVPEMILTARLLLNSNLDPT